jgi:phage-related tail fiber protein
MKLDPEPRLRGIDATVMDWARAVVRASNLVSGFFSDSNILAIANGGTGASTPAAARAALGAQIEPGMVFFHAANTPPPGAIKANGAAVSRTTYAALFAVIGTTFGVGNGTTTFNVPDLRGEFVRGWDDARGVDTGRVFGSAQLDAFQGFGLKVYATTTAAGASNLFYNFSSTVNATSGSLAGLTHFEARDAIANGFGTPRQATETRPRNVALLPCIKY